MINDLGDFFPYEKKRSISLTFPSEIVSAKKNVTISSGIKYF